jgi:hypothetical protein
MHDDTRSQILDHFEHRRLGAVLGSWLARWLSTKVPAR